MAQSPFQIVQQVPALKPVLLLAGLALAVAAGISVYMWSRGADWTPVATGLELRDSAEIVRSLEAVGIPARTADNGDAVSVPRTQLHAARMQLAGNDTLGPDNGFAMLSESPGFGVSQFMESARYQYALETELGRTIASLSPVRSARVHLAVARESAFVRDASRASASVVVDLRPGRSLDAAQAQAIVNLVAASVPQMDPSAVTVVDSAGNLLSDPDGEGSVIAASRQQFDLARQTEALLASRIIGLAEALVGEGRVRAQVTVEHDVETRQLASERVQADPAAITSEQLREERGGEPAGAAAGAAANMPGNPDGAAPAPAPAADPDAPPSLREVSREYAVGREYSMTEQPAGALKRVSAAVLVDHVRVTAADGTVSTRPLEPAEMQQLRQLVEGAIGFDAQRGDRLSIEHARFADAVVPAAPEAAPIWERYLDDGWGTMLARNFGGVLVLLVLIFAVLRPTLRALLQPVTVQAVDEPETYPRLAGTVAPDEGDDAPEPEMREAPYERQLQVARTVVQTDPKRVAQLMRTWVGSDG